MLLWGDTWCTTTGDFRGHLGSLHQHLVHLDIAGKQLKMAKKTCFKITVQYVFSVKLCNSFTKYVKLNTGATEQKLQTLNIHNELQQISFGKTAS